MLSIGLDRLAINMRIRTRRAIKYLHRVYLMPRRILCDIDRQGTWLLRLCVRDERLPALKRESCLAWLVAKGGQDDDGVRRRRGQASTLERSHGRERADGGWSGEQAGAEGFEERCGRGCGAVGFLSFS